MFRGARVSGDLSELGPRPHVAIFLHSQAELRSAGRQGSPELRASRQIRRYGPRELEVISPLTDVDRWIRPLAEVFGLALRLGGSPRLPQQAIGLFGVRYIVELIGSQLRQIAGRQDQQPIQFREESSPSFFRRSTAVARGRDEVPPFVRTHDRELRWSKPNTA